MRNGDAGALVASGSRLRVVPRIQARGQAGGDGSARLTSRVLDEVTSTLRAPVAAILDEPPPVAE